MEIKQDNRKARGGNKLWLVDGVNISTTKLNGDLPK